MSIPHDSSTKTHSRARFATAAAFFLDGITFATWVTRIPAIQDRLHLRNAALGVALFLMSLGALLTMPLAGRFIARRGSRLGVTLAVAAFGATLLLPAASTGIVTLSAALFLFGASFGAVNVSINAQAVAVERRYARPIMGSFHAIFSLGGIIGALLGSVAASQHLAPLIHFTLVGVVTVAGALLLSRLLVDDPAPVAIESAQRPRNTHLIFLGAIAFCSSFGEGSMSDWSAVFLRQISRSNPAVAALGFAAFSFSMTAGRFLADRITHAIGPVRLVRLSGTIAAAGLALAMLLPSAPTAIIGFALVGAGLSSLIPTLFSAAGKTPHVAPSVAIATVATTGYFGYLFGAPLIGLVSEVVTLRWALCLVFAAACVAVALARHVENRSTHTAGTVPPFIPQAQSAFV